MPQPLLQKEKMADAKEAGADTCHCWSSQGMSSGQGGATTPNW